MPWILFLAYWVIKAAGTRRTFKKESSASRYSVSLVLLSGYFLIFGQRERIGVLDQRFLPYVPLVVMCGIVLTWLGVALAIWARYHLAENWSARVTIKEGHELIRSGPYERLRHPIYTGLVLATFGSALAIGKWRCLLGVCLVLIGFSIKAKREEAMLAEEFGGAFQEHRRQTGFVLPRWR